MKVFQKLNVLCFALCFAGAGPAFGQDDLHGVWEQIGRKCEGAGGFMPVGDSARELTFHSGGRFQMAYHSWPGAGSGMTKEEFRKYKIRGALDRFERDRGLHEDACRDGDVGDIGIRLILFEGRQPACCPAGQSKQQGILRIFQLGGHIF